MMNFHHFSSLYFIISSIGVSKSFTFVRCCYVILLSCYLVILFVLVMLSCSCWYPILGSIGGSISFSFVHFLLYYLVVKYPEINISLVDYYLELKYPVEPQPELKFPEKEMLLGLRCACNWLLSWIEVSWNGNVIRPAQCMQLIIILSWNIQLDISLNWSFLKWKCY